MRTNRRQEETGGGDREPSPVSSVPCRASCQRVLPHGRVGVGFQCFFKLYCCVDVGFRQKDSFCSCQAADFAHCFFHLITERPRRRDVSIIRLVNSARLVDSNIEQELIPHSAADVISHFIRDPCISKISLERLYFLHLGSVAGAELELAALGVGEPREPNWSLPHLV